MMIENHILSDRKIKIYSNSDNPDFLLIQPTGQHESGGLDSEIELIGNSGKKFIFVSFEIKEWNNELSPWKSRQAFGNEYFGDDADKTLDFITGKLIPKMRIKYDNAKIILGGYSLAGLFSLWSAYRTDMFYAVSACSPSVWIDGWTEFAEQNPVHVKKAYLSIGNKEHKTRNAMMQTVKDKLIKQRDVLMSAGTDNILEINQGNHFADFEQRMAKGFIWCMG